MTDLPPCCPRPVATQCEGCGLCPACAASHTGSTQQVCERCSAEVLRYLANGGGSFEKCDLCHGTGEATIPPASEPGECFVCDGKGVVRSTWPALILKVGLSAWKPIQSYPLCPTGRLVSIRPCAERYNGKTFLGILIGEVSLGPGYSTLPDGTLVLGTVSHNAAILIPEQLGIEQPEVVLGCESWWGEISSPEDLRKITDKDIADTWYVQVLKSWSESCQG